MLRDRSMSSPPRAAALGAALVMLALGWAAAPLAAPESEMFDALMVGETSVAVEAETDGPDDVAAQNDPAALLAEWDKTADRAEEVIKKNAASTPAMEVMRATLANQRDAARALAKQAREEAEPLRKQIAALGPPPEDASAEPPDVAAERKRLTDRLALIEGRMRNAERAAARADALIAQVDAIIRKRFADQLMTLGPSPLNPLHWPGAVEDLASVAQRIYFEARQAMSDPIRSRERVERLPIVFLSFAIGGLAILYARARIMGWLMDTLDDAGRGRRLVIAAIAGVVRVLIPTLAAALFIITLHQSGLLGPLGSQALRNLVPAFVALIGARAIGNAYYAPYEPRLRLSGLNDADACRASRWTMLLGLALFIQALFVSGGEEMLLGPETLSLLNLIACVVGGVGMWMMARYIQPLETDARPESADGAVPPVDPEDAEPSILVRRAQALGALGLRFCAVSSVTLAAIGYFAASRYLLVPPIITVGLLGAAILLYTLIRDGVEAAIDPEQEASALRLLPIFVAFVIICILIPLLALVWGARVADLREWWGLLADGLVFGDVRISPMDFLTLIFVFAVGYTITRLIQTVMRTSVLPNTRLDVGGRTAIVSGLGYVGYTLSAIAAVTATGIDLSNLAIVAGALSVGIGFGLQTVVSNFVSGIILLVERPIKAGDWIEVGGKHGTVRKIAVRATEIETFDRATLIVPNSELIAGQVTNMTHGNTIGRVIVPVGVAYGSDVREVEKILLDIAEKHPLVLRYPAPSVLFQTFGESSLDFEIRAFLRDVNYVMSVKSQMNFEIERRLREAGIEIPFAQRDINFRDVDALRGVLAGRTAADEAAANDAAANDAAADGAAADGAAGAGRAPADDEGETRS